LSGKVGLFVNFQDYSVHDGSGLRSIVFLKGCYLRCTWCQNPECIRAGKEVMFREKLCIGCGECFKVCPADAIKADGYRIDLDKCTNCCKCAEVCAPQALKIVGTEVTVDSLVEKIESYNVFYKTSDQGGITISGGDPMFQPEFSLELLRECRKRGIHCAIETSAYGKPEVFMELVENLDLLLCDIKHMDEQKHIEGTGVSNKPILENLTRYSKMENKPDCVIRVPLVPGFNDDEKNIRETCRFIKSLNIRQVDLLPFNIMASNKYKEMGQEWSHLGDERQTDEKVEELAAIAREEGLAVTIGGLW